MNLTTLDLVYNFLQTDQPSIIEDKLETLIAGVSDQVELYLDRKFDLDTYTHQELGEGSCDIFLKNYPIKNILYAAVGAYKVLDLKYSGIKFPTVTVDENSETLILSEDSTAACISISHDSNMSDLSTLINAITDWSATVDSDYAKIPARSLNQISYTAIIDSDDTYNFELVAPVCKISLMKRNLTGHYVSNKLISEDKLLSVVYNGGYETTEDLPSGLQQVVSQIVAMVYNNSLKDGTLDNEKIGDYSYKVKTEVDNAIKTFKNELSMYKNHSV